MLGSIFAFVAGIGTAGLIAYCYPQFQEARARSSQGRDDARYEMEPGEFVDLNDATEEELQELKGIGPALAARIVENRPYRSKLELVSRMIIPETVYARIKDEIGVSDKATEEPIQVAL